MSDGEDRGRISRSTALQHELFRLFDILEVQPRLAHLKRVRRQFVTPIVAPLRKCGERWSAKQLHKLWKTVRSTHLELLSDDVERFLEPHERDEAYDAFSNAAAELCAMVGTAERVLKMQISAEIREERVEHAADQETWEMLAEGVRFYPGTLQLWLEEEFVQLTPHAPSLLILTILRARGRLFRPSRMVEATNNTSLQIRGPGDVISSPDALRTHRTTAVDLLTAAGPKFAAIAKRLGSRGTLWGLHPARKKCD